MDLEGLFGDFDFGDMSGMLVDFLEKFIEALQKLLAWIIDMGAEDEQGNGEEA